MLCYNIDWFGWVWPQQDVLAQISSKCWGFPHLFSSFSSFLALFLLETFKILLSFVKIQTITPPKQVYKLML